MWVQRNEHVIDPTQNPVLRLFRRFVPTTDGYREQRFIVHEGGRRLATPLLAVLVVVETSDILFAIDSVPAIFSVTTDAVPGLQLQCVRDPGAALAVLPARGRGRQVPLPQARTRGVARSSPVSRSCSPTSSTIPIPLSLAIIVGILAVAIGASVVADRLDGRSARRRGRNRRATPHRPGTDEPIASFPARTSAAASGSACSLVAVVVVAAVRGATPSPTPPPAPTAGAGHDPRGGASPRSSAHEPRLTGIGPLDPDLIGQSSWYEVVPASGVGAFLVKVTVGWGDCPAGCINGHTWLYAVLPDGTVTLQSEEGDVVPPDAWPSPGGAGQTGLLILATAGPVCPVETNPPDPACAPRPVAGAEIRVLDAGGQTIGSVVTAADGSAFLGLAPGSYTVQPQPVEGLMGTAPGGHGGRPGRRRDARRTQLRHRHPLNGACRAPIGRREHRHVALARRTLWL